MINLSNYKKIFREFATDADFINEVIVNLKLNRGSKILDIGTGMGAMSILLALNGFKVLTGEPEVDPEKDDSDHHDHHHEVINEVQYDKHEEHNGVFWDDWRKSAKNLGVEDKINYQNFDIYTLPFENLSFDGIFLYDTLQHVTNKEPVLNECVRVLKRDGVLVIIEWTKHQIEEDFKKYGYKIEYINPSDFFKREDILIEELNSEAVNVFLLKKK